MKYLTRIGLAAVMFAVVYGGGLYVVPPLVYRAGLMGYCPWLKGTSLVSQLTFLILSLGLTALVARGRFASYGWRLVAVRKLVMPIVISTLATLLLMAPMIISAFMAPEEAAEQPGSEPRGPMSKNLLHTIIFVWIIASTCEEVFYRGLLQSFLAPLGVFALKIRSVRISLPVVLCGLTFGLGHLCLRGMIPTPMLASILIFTTVGGLIAGYYREKTGSLIPAIAAHMTCNVVGTMVPVVLNFLATS